MCVSLSLNIYIGEGKYMVYICVYIYISIGEGKYTVKYIYLH